MFRFENPTCLYALGLVVLLAAIHYYMNYIRNKRLRRYGDPALLKDLMPDVSRIRPEVKFWLAELALTLLIFALARPQFGTKVDTRKRQGIEAIIALDVSNSMLAEDVTPCRLDKAKLLISKMVDELQDDKIGVIVYAGDAYIQLPITSDYVSAKMFLDAISPDMISVQGTDIRAAIELAMKSFTTDAESSKAVFVITDGEDNEGGAVEAAREAAQKGIRVYVLGIGSPKGAPIPIQGSSHYVIDNEGNTVVSKLNEAMCRDIAQAGNGAYIYVDNSSSAQSALLKHVDKLAKKEMESTIYSEYDEQFPAFILLALLILLADGLIRERKNPLFKGIKLFHK